MKQNIPWEQLARYFAGELTKEEGQKMKSWIKADSERKQQVHKLYHIWKESGSIPYKLNIDEAWQTLSGNMDKLEQKEHQAGNILTGSGRIERIPRPSKPNNKNIRRSGRMARQMFIAAAATILLAAGLFTYFNYEFKGNQTAEVARKELSAGEGERATYLLNDGSRVILHAGSRLEVPIQYNVDSRELFLEGEAYFEVTHDSTKPFIVRSRHAYTHVLGTRFLVQAWDDDAGGEVEVVVAEGKVAFGDSRSPGTAGKEVIITRNQKGLLTGEKDPVVTDNADLDWYLGWTQGKLVFDNRPFGEIIPRLERWYVLDIQTEDKRIMEKKLTAEIDYSQPMGEVLKGIALSLDLEFEKEGRNVTFRFKDQDG